MNGSGDLRLSSLLPEGWVNIRDRFQETWGLTHPLMDLTFGLEIGSKLEEWFLKLGVISCARTPEIWWKSDTTSAMSVFHTLDSLLSVNSLGLKFWCQPIVSLDFGVSLVLDPSEIQRLQTII